MTKRYKQSGRNSAYPEYIEVWEYGVGSVPDWIPQVHLLLSD